ncbi:hypothetical protein DMENIID0001_145530 [Sergentomyia squamirostris]
MSRRKQSRPIRVQDDDDEAATGLTKVTDDLKENIIENGCKFDPRDERVISTIESAVPNAANIGLCTKRPKRSTHHHLLTHEKTIMS